MRLQCELNQNYPLMEKSGPVLSAFGRLIDPPLAEQIGLAYGNNKLHPPSLMVRQLTDFEEFRHLFGTWGGRFQQTSRGRFSGTAAVYAGLSVRAFLAETNQAIFTRGLDRTDLVTVIPITEANETTSWRGRQLARGHLLIKGA